MTDLPDEDEDGLPDEFEASGLVVSNAQVFYTDPENPDCDGDGLLDGEEITSDDFQITVKEDLESQEVYTCVTFRYCSDPCCEDTDGDGYSDNDDFAPLEPISDNDRIIYEFFENAEDFEIRYVLENPWIQQLGTLKGIKCVEICRRHLDDRNLKEIEKEMISAELMTDPANKKPIDKIMQFLCGHYGNPSTMLFSEYELYKNDMSFSDLMEVSWIVWGNGMKLVAQIWCFGVSNLIQQGWAEWDYSPEYKLSLEQEKGLKEFTEYVGDNDLKLSRENKYENVEKFRVQKEGKDVISSLKETGELPEDYITKEQAEKLGWNKGRALNNYAPGKKLGGNIFENSGNLLPSKPERTWFEADVGIDYTMKRSNLKNPGYRILYSNDGLIYGTFDHYKSFFYIGTY